MLWNPDQASCRSQNLSIDKSSLKFLAAKEFLLHQRHRIDAILLESMNWGFWHQMWQFIQFFGYDSLNLWLLFGLIFGENFLGLYPEYHVALRTDSIQNFPEVLQQVHWELPDNVRHIVKWSGELTHRDALRIISIPNLCWLDLSAAKVSEMVVRALRQSLEYGALTNLEYLCLPRFGPAELRPLLSRPWSKTLKYIETPVNPKSGWRRTRHASHPTPAIVLEIGSSKEEQRAKAYRRT